MPGSHPSTSSSTSTPPSATANSGTWSKRSFFSTVVLFFGRLPFALLVLHFIAAFSSLYFGNML
jgi:hypothetical protein